MKGLSWPAALSVAHLPLSSECPLPPSFCHFYRELPLYNVVMAHSWFSRPRLYASSCAVTDRSPLTGSLFRACCLTGAQCRTGCVLSIIIYLLLQRQKPLHLTSLFHQLWIDYWMWTSAQAAAHAVWTHLVTGIRSSIKLLFIVRPKKLDWEEPWGNSS